MRRGQHQATAGADRHAPCKRRSMMSAATPPLRHAAAPPARSDTLGIFEILARAVLTLGIMLALSGGLALFLSTTIR
jgi:hypothetical protein